MHFSKLRTYTNEDKVKPVGNILKVVHFVGLDLNGFFNNVVKEENAKSADKREGMSFHEEGLATAATTHMI